jgi:hypothetical protein
MNDIENILEFTKHTALEAGALTGHIADELPHGTAADLYGQGLVAAAPGIFHEFRALLQG